MAKSKLDSLLSNTRKLFLIDGVGAIFSAFMLGVVLVELESIFGIPSSTLYFLATFPVLFALYDVYCYRKAYDKSSAHLKAIALVNLMYCCLSIGLALHHMDTITYLGWAYLLGEILIVTVLAIIELKAAGKMDNDASTHHKLS